MGGAMTRVVGLPLQQVRSRSRIVLSLKSAKEPIEWGSKFNVIAALLGVSVHALGSDSLFLQSGQIPAKQAKSGNASYAT